MPAHAGDSGRASADQVKAIVRLARDANVVVNDRVLADFEVGEPEMLTPQQARVLIGALQKEASEQLALRGVYSAVVRGGDVQ